jgi:hypothetical protein
MTTIFFHPSLLLLFLDPGSEIRDPGWVKIRIRDKHPGSATLDSIFLRLLARAIMRNNSRAAVFFLHLLTYPGSHPSSREPRKFFKQITMPITST